MTRIHQVLAICLATLFLGNGCGTDGDSARPSGVITATWSNYCTAVFTQDHVVKDRFDDDLFTAKDGEAYLVRSIREFGGKYRADLLYVTNSSPITFEFEADNVADFPFESNCAPGEIESRIAVFATINMYADEMLTELLCTLNEGDTAMGNIESRLISEPTLGGSAPLTYLVSTGGFAGDCGNEAEAYVSAKPVRMFGTSYFYTPIKRVSLPR